MNYSDIKVGDKATIEKKITDEDVRAFADLSLDHNPIHLDDEYAKDGMFGKRIAHGMLGASLISACIGTKLPGENTLYLGQDLKFTKPVYLDDTCVAEVEVIKMRDDKQIITLKTTVTTNDGADVVIEGEAVVKKM